MEGGHVCTGEFHPEAVECPGRKSHLHTICPTISSALELKDESWIKTFILKMEQFLKKIGE